ncbi:MAG: fluoride efflux transporter CrcB [Cyclobacteriaceae bacterium]
MNMLKPLLLIGIGGFFGSICRFLVNDFFQKNYPNDYPWGTFAANMLGCFLIGLILGAASSGNIPKALIWLFATGFCGAFTTFSTFSFESYSLLNDSKMVLAIMYVGVSVVVGLLCTWVGIGLSKAVI